MRTTSPTNSKGFLTTIGVVVTLVLGMLAFNAISGNNGTSAASNLDPVCVTNVKQWNVKHPGNPQDANVLCVTAGAPTNPTTADTTPDTTTADTVPATTDTTITVDIGTPPLPPSTVAITSTGWNINKIDVANDPIVDAWLNQLRDPAPQLWQTFPNIANPLVPEFNVANGMEYGVANVPFCQQDMRCDFIVPAQHYRLITADYSFNGMTCTSGDTGKGCMLLLINVGDTSYTWRNQMSDNGFTVSGRYFNGDALDMGVWGLVSHASANMLNMPTVSHPGETLNDGVMTNGGSNCGVPQGCSSVEVTIVVHAGDRILAVATTTVTR